MRPAASACRETRSADYAQAGFLDRLSCVDKRDATLFSRANWAATSAKPIVGGMFAAHGHRHCISTTLFCWNAQNNFVVHFRSSHNPIPQANWDVPLQRCPTSWNDLHNRGTYVLSGFDLRQNLSIHAPFHIATKPFSRTVQKLVPMLGLV